jgi:hypothetical protein
MDPGRVAWYAAWATVIGLPISIATLLAGLMGLSDQVRGVRAVADRAEAEVVKGQLRIGYPSDGGSVGMTAQVRGFSPYPHRFHYLSVGAPTGGNFIQDGPLDLSPIGVFTGRAIFGNVSAGVGEVFTLRVAATDHPLRPGSEELPDDTVYSNPIYVTRTK